MRPSSSSVKDPDSRLDVPMNDQSSQAAMQEWVLRRFAGISPHHFHQDGLVFFACATLSAPDGFEDVWYVFDGDDVSDFFSRHQVYQWHRHAAILLVGHPQIETQVNRICMISRRYKQIAPNRAQLLFWVPHTTEHDSRSRSILNEDVLQRTLDSGVSDVICGEPRGVLLAIAVESKIRHHETLLRDINDIRTARLDSQRQLDTLKASINETVWQYLRQRLRSNLPEIDPNFEPGTPRQVGEFEVHNLLGEGGNGRVYSLIAPGQGPSHQVVKIVRKASVAKFKELEATSRQINIMIALSRDQPHRNIVRLIEVYHTDTHILFCMEDGGLINLCERLQLRERQNGEAALSIGKVIMLIFQAMEAVEHLHSQCKVAHLDLKPENIVLSESDTDILLKLIDFDSAMVVEPGRRTAKIAGTFPFFAPEVFMQEPYLPFPADVWSLGVVISEIVCGVSIVQRVVWPSSDLRRNQRERTMDEEILTCYEVNQGLTREVAMHFDSEDARNRMLDSYARNELHPLVDPMRPVFESMLNVAGERRLPATELLQLCQYQLQPLRSRDEGQ